MFVFRRGLRALFSCNTSFEIFPFTLLSTIYVHLFLQNLETLFVFYSIPLRKIQF